MSSAFYTQGMNSWNNRLPQGGYKTWKGRGVYQNPVGITSTHIRPLTNNDPGNVFPTGFGLPRPMKHYRTGRNIPTFVSQDDAAKYGPTETSLIDYNLNRAVKSANGSSLGGGSGGTGLISDFIGTPGSFSIKENNLINNYNAIDKECKNCVGIGMVSDWYPINNLTEKPEPNVTNKLLCCNEQRKARRRVLPTSTLVKKDYYQTSYMRLFNRCQTFQQRQFNFIQEGNPAAKPGDPLSIGNLYVAQCNPNVLLDDPTGATKGCKRVYYKPNNPQFANEGAVSSSTQILKLNVDTIGTNEALNNRYNKLTTLSDTPNIPYIYKFKSEKCNPATYSGNPFFFSGQHQNHMICSKQSADVSKNYVSINQRSRGNYIGATLP